MIWKTKILKFGEVQDEYLKDCKIGQWLQTNVAFEYFDVTNKELESY